MLVDTPLAPYFSECVSSEDLDEMNVEIMRNILYKVRDVHLRLQDTRRFQRVYECAEGFVLTHLSSHSQAYLSDFLKLCEKLGGATATLMKVKDKKNTTQHNMETRLRWRAKVYTCVVICHRRFLTTCERLSLLVSPFPLASQNILQFEADRRAINITINSLDTELSRDDRRRLFSEFGTLYPSGHLDLVACDDYEQVRAVMDNSPSFATISSKLSVSADQILEKVSHVFFFFSFFSFLLNLFPCLLFPSLPAVFLRGGNEAMRGDVSSTVQLRHILRVHEDEGTGDQKYNVDRGVHLAGAETQGVGRHRTHRVVMT